MVLKYAEGGSLKDWVEKNHKNFDWLTKIKALSGIIQGLNEIHQKKWFIVIFIQEIYYQVLFP